jgi:hypothetical protein
VERWRRVVAQHVVGPLGEIVQRGLIALVQWRLVAVLQRRRLVTFVQRRRLVTFVQRR